MYGKEIMEHLAVVKKRNELYDFLCKLSPVELSYVKQTASRLENLEQYAARHRNTTQKEQAAILTNSQLQNSKLPVAPPLEDYTKMQNAKYPT